MKKILLFLCFLTFFSFGCSKSRPKAKEPSKKEFPTKVFSQTDNKKLFLELSSPPKETPAGFTRVSGITNGRSFSALLEIQGKGVIVEKGDVVSGIKIEEITEKGVFLCAGK